MANVWLDFETKSSLSLPLVGQHRYLNDAQAGVVCLAWAIDDSPPKLWLPGQPVPFDPSQCDHIYAFNAIFDWDVWNTFRHRHGWREWPLVQTIDVMGLVARYTLPLKMDQAAKVLNTRYQKRKSGHVLMKKMCDANYKKPVTLKEKKEFYAYCIDDVNTMREVVRMLPAASLSDEEQRIWVMTQRINMRGLPIDTQAVRSIRTYTEEFRAMKLTALPRLTGGMVESINQIQKIRDWLETKGIKTFNLDAETVGELLGGTALDPSVKQVLNLRKEFGRASVAKYKKLDEQTYLDTIYINLRYHAVAPGRWGGLGFQMHNLPRPVNKYKPDEIEKIIQNFKMQRIMDDPMGKAKDLVRSMVKAKDGEVLIVADYKSIENRIVLWLCKEVELLKAITEGADLYVKLAARMYHIPYEEVTEFQRFTGKIVELGSQYNLSGPGLVGYGGQFGLDFSGGEAEGHIRAYRSTHARIVSAWDDFHKCAVMAIRHREEEFAHLNTTFKCTADRNGNWWLLITLPSGRAMFYYDPYISEEGWGDTIVHMGFSSTTHQWCELRLIKGRIMNNIVQGLARDVLVFGKQLVELYLMNEVRVRGSVHDEIIATTSKKGAQGRLDRMMGLMCTEDQRPAWANGILLDAEGYVSKRYRKG